eukprot:2356702-Rhodomonas_salina.1
MGSGMGRMRSGMELAGRAQAAHHCTHEHGPKDRRRHADAVTRRRGDTETRKHGDAVTRRRGDTETRRHGRIAPHADNNTRTAADSHRQKDASVERQKRRTRGEGGGRRPVLM